MNARDEAVAEVVEAITRPDLPVNSTPGVVSRHRSDRARGYGSTRRIGVHVRDEVGSYPSWRPRPREGITGTCRVYGGMPPCPDADDSCRTLCVAASEWPALWAALDRLVAENEPFKEETEFLRGAMEGRIDYGPQFGEEE